MSRSTLVFAGATIAAVATGLAFAADWFGRVLRAGLEQLSPLVTVEVAAAGTLLVIASALFPSWRRWLERHRRLVARTLRLELFTHGTRHPVLALTFIVAVAGACRLSLGRASAEPYVLGDELIYTGLAKSWAFTGTPAVREELEIGHSLLYPLLLAPVYRAASDGVEALTVAKSLNAVLFAAAAIPAYLLARRVATTGWSLAVAALTAAAPWGAYSGLALTESLFYPLVLAYACVLASALEHGGRRREALMLVTLAVLCAVRPQALALAAATLLAVVGHEALAGRARGAPRRFPLLFGAVPLALAVAVVAPALDLQIPTGSYSVLYSSLGDVVGMAKWTAWTLGMLVLSLGVAAAAAWAPALAGMVRREAPASARAVGITVIALSGGLLGSVALLSATPYGLDWLHERNLFYVAPLVLVCVAAWGSTGCSLPLRVTAPSVAVAFALPALLPSRLVLDRVSNVDAPTVWWLRQLALDVPSLSWRSWSLVLGGMGIAVLLLGRSGGRVLFAAALAFLAVSATTDYKSGLSPQEAGSFSWVDRALPAGETATLVHVEYTLPAGVCAEPARLEQQTLGVFTEMLNVRLSRVVHLGGDLTRSGLASGALERGEGGLILEQQQPFTPRYAVLDSRQPIVGSRVTRFDLARRAEDYQAGASLTLWRVDPPLRFYAHPDPLPPRADGSGC